MYRARDALIVKRLFQPPALFHQYVAEFFDVIDDAWAFVGADIQPDARQRFDEGALRKTQNNALIPPQGGGERCNFSKTFGQAEPEVERNQPAERGPANASILRSLRNAIIL